MDLHLTGKIVVVTGGGTGIGRAIAAEFLREGARVAVLGRRVEPLKAFAGQMEEEGFPPVYYQSCDVTRRDEVRAFADAVVERFGAIDVWINNAGVDIKKRFLDYTEEEYDYITGIDLKSVFLCTQIVAPIMKKQGGGVIINASSYNARIPHANGVIYAAAKSGVSSFTRATAGALAPYGIRVLSYIPGMILTEMSKEIVARNGDRFIRDISLRRLGTPEDLAKPVVFMASDCAAYMSGVDIEITGGKFAVQDCDMAYRMEDELNA